MEEAPCQSKIFARVILKILSSKLCLHKITRMVPVGMFRPILLSRKQEKTLSSCKEVFSLKIVNLLFLRVRRSKQSQT